MIIDRFVTVLADTDDAREIHFGIRYKVFCDETGFEDTERFPDGKERDTYDPDSHHFIVWDRSERRWVGAMRLVDANRTRLPSEDICPAPLKELDQYRGRSVEFSRLCLLQDYRRTPEAMTFGLYSPEGSRTEDLIPVYFRQHDNEIALRLLYASCEWARHNDIEYCYFIITPALSRILTRMGLPLIQVGDPVTHRGTRIPYRYHAQDAMKSLTDTLPSYSRMVASSPGYVTYSDLISGRLGIATSIKNTGLPHGLRNAASKISFGEKTFSRVLPAEAGPRHPSSPLG
jgi:N-acyl amino acid synthase of PEP-CTERM/exosortase system